MKLIQTQDYRIVPRLWPWARKYLARVPAYLHEGELKYFVSAFHPNADNRLAVLVDEETGELHGYVLFTLEKAYNHLFIQQIGVDDIKALKEELVKLADRAGAVRIAGITHRNPMAYKRAIGMEPKAVYVELDIQPLDVYSGVEEVAR